MNLKVRMCWTMLQPVMNGIAESFAFLRKFPARTAMVALGKLRFFAYLSNFKF